MADASRIEVVELTEANVVKLIKQILTLENEVLVLKHQKKMLEKHPLSLQRPVDALRGLYGLLQLIESKGGISGEWRKNHRVIEALAVMALEEQHGSRDPSA